MICLLVHWDSIGNGFLLDVRNPQELEVESVTGCSKYSIADATFPFERTYQRIVKYHVFCRSAQRAYYATRILLQNGFKAKNISGGMLARSHKVD